MYFFEATEDVAKIGSSLKSNHNKYTTIHMIHTVRMDKRKSFFLKQFKRNSTDFEILNEKEENYSKI
jgi:hypothetical protein